MSRTFRANLHTKEEKSRRNKREHEFPGVCFECGEPAAFNVCESCFVASVKELEDLADAD